VGCFLLPIKILQKKNNLKLSIVIPAFNEIESLPQLVSETILACESFEKSFEIIIIDDGSTDGTFDWIIAQHQKDPRILGIQLRLNCGKAAALNVAFKEVTGDVIITLDGDLQDDPKEISEMVNMLGDDCDLVSGWKKNRQDPLSKRLPSKLFNIITRLVSGVKLHDFNCGFKAYKNEVVNSLNLYGEFHRYIPVLAKWNGFQIKEKMIEHRARQYGHSKYGLARLTNGMFDLITLLFLHKYTRRPLHLFGLLGLLFNVLGGVILSYFLISWIVTGSMHIRPLLMGGVASILLGFQIVSLGLLAEMIAQKSNTSIPIAARASRKSNTPA